MSPPKCELFPLSLLYTNGSVSKGVSNTIFAELRTFPAHNFAKNTKVFEELQITFKVKAVVQRALSAYSHFGAKQAHTNGHQTLLSFFSDLSYLC